MMNTAFNQWLQQFQPPFLIAAFRAITALGGETFYTIAIPVIYWCFDKGFGFGLGTVFLTSAWANVALKNVFRIPRPSVAEVRVLDNPGGYSFPSGHAQGTGTFWTYCALRIRRRWFTVATVAAIILVSLSRPYLGVHYLTDILGGSLIGIGIALVYFWAERRQLRIPTWAFVAAPILMVLLDHTADGAKTAGMLLGLGLGVRADEATLDFRTRTAAPWQQAAKIAVGIAVVLGLRIGLKLIFPDTAVFGFIRYACIGLGAAYGAPYLFVRFGWAERGVGPT